MNPMIYAIRDKKAEAFMQPYYANTPGLAIRTFETNVNQQDSIFNAYPDDFELYEIGTFDDAKGKVIPHEHNVLLGTARDYLHPDNVTEMVSG